jgi:hypothetical protein
MLTAGFALFMGVLGVVGYSPETFAGLTGLIVLALLWVISLPKPWRPILRLAWLLMLATYVVACIVTIWLRRE